MEWGSRLLVLTALALCVGLYAWHEWSRHAAIYNLCARNYEVYQNFSQTEVCTTHPMTKTFEAYNLTNCVEAENQLLKEPPQLCAQRNWYITSWVHAIVQAGVRVYSQATDYYMIMLVLPILGLVVILYRIHDEGTTKRHALTQESQSQVIDAVTRVTATLQKQQQAFATQQQVYYNNVEQSASQRRRRARSIVQPPGLTPVASIQRL